MSWHSCNIHITLENTFYSERTHSTTVTMTYNDQLQQLQQLQQIPEKNFSRVKILVGKKILVQQLQQLQQIPEFFFSRVGVRMEWLQ